MKRVLSEEKDNDFEPTPRVGPCVEELLAKSEELDEINSVVQNREADWVDLLLYDNNEIQFYLRTFVGIDCLHIVQGILESCSEAGKEICKRYVDYPEVSRIDLQGDCIFLFIPHFPSLRIRKFMEKIAIRPERILAYRLIYEEGDILDS